MWIDDLQKKSKKVYSQGGQDGLVEFIFKNIGVTNKFCVEFGFNSNSINGGSGANTSRLVIEDGWQAVFFDADYENTSINLYKETLTPENIGEIFKKYNIPQNPDYVSIDVDSIDLWLFRGMVISGYKPRLVSVEYNCNFPITVSATLMPGSTWNNFDSVYGASLLALNRAADELGYKLICVEERLDAFFLLKELVNKEINLEYFAQFTNLKGHNPPTPERFKLFVQYPSLEPLS